MKDAIVEEVRKARKELFAQFDNDLRKAADHYIDAQSQDDSGYVRRESITLQMDGYIEKAEEEEKRSF